MNTHFVYLNIFFLSTLMNRTKLPTLNVAAMRQHFYKTAVEIFCFLFILLFVYTGANKLMDHTTFSNQLIFVTDHEMVGTFLSYLVPVLELITALLLSIQRTRIAGLYLFTLMIAGFTGYILYLLMSSRKLPCSCGGVISSMTWKQHLWFNGVFLIAAIATLILLTSDRYIKPIVIQKKSF